VSTRVGYAGGARPDPTYYSLGDHTESLQVDYDPEIVSYEELMNIFWNGHDPFSKPFSRQYAAILFYHDQFQEKAARDHVARLEKEHGRKVQTEVVPFRDFYMAEDYHQKYYLKGTPAVYGELQKIYPGENDLVASTAAARINGYLGGNGSLGQLRKELSLLGLSPEGQKQIEWLFHSR